jgi:hypothetical protein
MINANKPIPKYKEVKAKYGIIIANKYARYERQSHVSVCTVMASRIALKVALLEFRKSYTFENRQKYGKKLQAY